MKNKIQIISHTARRARVTMLVPFGKRGQGSEVRGQEESGRWAVGSGQPESGQGSEVRDQLKAEAGESLVVDDAQSVFETLDQLKPVDGDFIHPVFRALSATLIPGYWLDYSTPGVLEDSVPLLLGQTVYKNHDFRDVEQWLGVVSRAYWDATGASSDGCPGINVEMKIDWKMNPRIARGLLMQPPAIHSASVTVLFEYEYSHTGLVENGRFWEMLGEEFDGEIVRLIVTKILGYWEISLVFQGADQLARQISDAPDVVGEMSVSAVVKHDEPGIIQTTSSLLNRLANQLGISNQVESEPDEEILSARIADLNKAAEQGQQILASARNEALRVARLAEAGPAMEVAAPVEQLIKTATPDQLEQLTLFYTERAARRFPHTCQVCGATSHLVRSSIEPPLKESAEKIGVGLAHTLH